VGLRLADVLAVDNGGYLLGRVSAAAARAYEAIRRCHTAALGGHVARCEKGHLVGVFYNGCRHRSCPRCGWGLGRRWLERRARTLLGCGHHHVILTVPHVFNVLWASNYKLFARILFKSAQEAIRDLAADPRYLGAEPGLIAALHTWGQLLGLHVHLHCLVTAGGVSSSGEWVASRRKWFLPATPLVELFSGKVIYALRGAARKGDLRLPVGWTIKQLERLCDRAKAERWNLNVRERYESPTHVLNYLGRYLNGGPINESRLQSVTEAGVVFRYKDYRDTDASGMPRHKIHTMEVGEFVARLMQHVPPKGLHLVRGYGAYSGNVSTELLARLREALPLSAEIRVTTRPRWPQPDDINPRPQECPTCGAPLHLLFYGRAAPGLAA
jgi:glycosyltransferase involved in cell wall biosynthesis